MNENSINKYLRLLGLKQKPPSLEYLTRITTAQIIRVPFENISKLIYKKEGMNFIPGLSRFLEGIEKYNFGGTCYSNNYYLFLLLSHLGFNARLSGADMQNPDVHLVIIVTLEGREYLVDAGYAAPFFFPVDRYLESSTSVCLGREEYIIYPADHSGKTKVEQYKSGQLEHWYTAKPEARKFEEFKKVVQDSFANDATFINVVRISLFKENYSLVLRNLSLTENCGTESSTVLLNQEALPEVINNKFGMPKDQVQKAIEGLGRLDEFKP